MTDLVDANPDLQEAAPQPEVEYVRVAGTTLYTEMRGSGPAVLVIGAADEDAEFYRGIADRLSDEFTVVTYDRRGTRRSGREDWPGGGSIQHADDAASLVTELRLAAVTVFGVSAGAIVALQLALRHAREIRTALCFEPGLFDMVPGGAEFRQRIEARVEDHLVANPEDWAGASAVLGRAAVDSLEVDSRGLFTPPPGREWFGARAESNAESLLRGDLALTGESVDVAAIAKSPVDIRFAYGAASLPIFREITERLAAARAETPDAIEGMGHAPFYNPDAAALYIRSFLV
ncbi:MAG TPA: alpha/beta hydrolase [Acidimicrobiia bacterium]|nr:alpha/beta hydrolase [Acidimicrobiia bacterium]